MGHEENSIGCAKIRDTNITLVPFFQMGNKPEQRGLAGSVFPLQKHGLLYAPVQVQVTVNLGFGGVGIAVGTTVGECSLTDGKVFAAGARGRRFFGNGFELEKEMTGAYQGPEFRQGAGAFLDGLVTQEYGRAEQDKPLAVHPASGNKDSAEGEHENHGQHRDGFHHQGKTVLADRETLGILGQLPRILLEVRRKNGPFLGGTPGAEKSSGCVEVVSEFRPFEQQGFFFGAHAVDHALKPGH